MRWPNHYVDFSVSAVSVCLSEPIEADLAQIGSIRNFGTITALQNTKMDTHLWSQIDSRLIVEKRTWTFVSFQPASSDLNWIFA